MLPISEVQVLGLSHPITLQSCLNSGVQVRAISPSLSSVPYRFSVMSAQLRFFSWTSPAPVSWWGKLALGKTEASYTPISGWENQRYFTQIDE